MKWLLVTTILTVMAAPCQAASIFWSTAVTAGGGASCGDGTFKWDSDSGTAGAAHKCWATASGGTTASALPGASDTAVFDANSGSGTVVVQEPNNASGAAQVNIGGLTTGAYGGGLNFNTNNDNVTLTLPSLAGNAFSNTGTGTRTINLGSGTWTVNVTTGVGNTAWNWATLTNCTCTASAATINFNNQTAAKSGNNITFGATTYGTVGIAGAGGFALGATTITTLNLTAPTAITIANATTLTITNNFTWTGSAGSWIFIAGPSVSQATPGIISVAAGSGTSTCTYCIIRSINFTGTGVTFTGTNTIDLGGNTNMTISAPTVGGGGGGFIIGG